MDVFDPQFHDVVGKDPDEPWDKNLWLFNIRDDPNEGSRGEFGNVGDPSSVSTTLNQPISRPPPPADGAF